MALDSRAIGFPSIKNINVSDKNLSIILQNMKERIERYKLAFEEQQRDIAILAKRLSEQEVAKEQIELRGDFEETDMTDVGGEELSEWASPPTDDVRYVAEDFIPAGIIVDWGGTVAPTGWLECDGAAISRITYARLFNSIGTTWGSGDGSTTFNLPDQSNAYRIGLGADPVGSTVGNTNSELDLTHSHDASDGINELTTSTDGAHTHSVTGSTSSDGTHNHGGTTGAPSATTDVETPVAPVTVASSTHTHSISDDGSHTHTISGTAASNGNHDHDIEGETAEQNAHVSTGVGNLVDIRPESRVVMWIIKI